MRFLVVTATFNRSDFLEDTILSVINQAGDFEIDYIVQDGGSQDKRLLSILEHYENAIRTKEFIPRCRSINFRWFSNRDSGMYDAISSGFQKGDGDVMCWINSDDMFHPYAFETVRQVFETHSDIHWITGIPNSYNESGSRCGFDNFPPSYSRELILRECYRAHFLDYGLNWIQQESTFWRRKLWDSIDHDFFARYKYAADFYLWKSFARKTDMVKVLSFLGGYRVHSNQITASPEIYNAELSSEVLPPKHLKAVNRLLTTFPFLKRPIFSRPGLARAFFSFFGLKLEWVVGRIVYWSFTEKKWIQAWREIF